MYPIAFDTLFIRSYRDRSPSMASSASAAASVVVRLVIGWVVIPERTISLRTIALESTSVIRTALTELVGIEHPVVCAGMGSGMSDGDLAGAVSEAGGLGIIGASWLSADEVTVRINT
jgi:hypothetical protein